MLWLQSEPAPQTLGDVFAKVREGVLAAVPHLITGVVVFAFFWIAARVGQSVIAYAAPRVRADTGVVLLLSRVYYYGVLIFGLVTALGTAGLDVRALVAGLGLTGFALGFALKDVLSNFVADGMLLAYRPFRLGDLIEMGEFAGTIETIRIRDTLVRAEDGRLIVIPNTKLITEVVVNHSDAARTGRAIHTTHAGATQAATPNVPHAEATAGAARAQIATARSRAAKDVHDEEEDEPTPARADDAP